MQINELAEDVWAWADAAFPARTDQSMFLKMYSEVGEMADAPEDPLEFADTMILLLDYAVRKGFDIEKAIKDKLAINCARQWKVNELGVMRHVEQSSTPSQVPCDRSGDSHVSGQTLAHGGHDTSTDPGRTQLQCSDVDHGDRNDRPGDVLRAE